MKKKILIGPSTFGAADSSVMNKLLNADFKVIGNPFGRKLTKKELLELLPGINGLIAGLETLDREVLEKSKLRVISRCGVGMDNIDLKTAKNLGIKVYSTPEAPTVAVAELTVGSMIALLRSIPQMDRDLHQGRWSKKIGSQLNGKTIVIIGFGRIGRYVAKLLKAFDVKIIVVDPHVSLEDVKSEGFEIATSDKALPLADIITIHTSEDKEIIGNEEFKLVKKGAFLLNSARGRVINESTLIEAIENGKIAGVWLDTFTEEPYKGPLAKYEQVILTPHVGSYARECRNRMENEAVDNLMAGFCKLEGKDK